MSSPLATGLEGARVTGSLTRSMVVGVRGLRLERDRASKAFRIALSVTAPLLLGVATGHVSYGLAAAFGAFTAFHGHVAPYPQRARLLALMGTGYLAAVLAGSLATTSEPALILVTGGFAFTAAFVCQSLALLPPREIMLILICLIVGSLPGPLAPLPGLALLVVGGAAWAWLVLMSGWLTDRERPEREAVRAGLRATIDLLGDVDGTDVGAQHAAVLAVRSARRSVEFAGGPTAPLLRRVQLEAEDILDRVLGMGPAPVPGAAEALAALAPIEDRRIALRARARELLAQTDAAMPEPGFRRGEKNPDAPPPLRSGMWSLRNGLGRHSLVVPAAARIGVAVAGGLLVGQLSGAPRPYWIALTTAAVLQGSTLLITARRAIERAAGTLVGVLFAGLLVVADPGQWAIVLGVGVFLFLAQLTIGASYVVAVAFLTPMTLLLAEIGQPGQLSNDLVLWRLADTVIGCVLGYAAGRLLWPHSARERLDEVLPRTLDQIRAVLHPGTTGVHAAVDASALDAAGAGGARWRTLGRGGGAAAAGRGGRKAAAAGRAGRPVTVYRGSESERERRHALRVGLLNLRAVTDAGLGDTLTAAPLEDQLWLICAATQQLGYRALAARGVPSAALDVELARLSAIIDERREAVREGWLPRLRD